MSKGVVIHLDNDLEGILIPAKNLFEQMELELTYIICTTKEEFDTAVNENRDSIKALIFDLLGQEPTYEEINKDDAEFLENIRISYANYNIPIFIHSAYLKESILYEFKNCGTVFIIDKGEDNGIQEIFNKVNFLLQSGFMEVFCPGGVLDTQLKNDLHQAFTRQFINNQEISNIISQIKGQQTYEETTERIKKVFKRITIRTLLSELLAPEIDEKGNPKEEEETVNTVEHYIRRINSIPVWTGDIFKKKSSEDFIFILTPRCNVIRNTQILVCPFHWKDNITKDKYLSKMLQGDPTFSGYDRHIPPSPIFEGGKLALSKYFMLDKSELLVNYELIVSLSDELTNEIIGKFGAHFFRTGITPWDRREVQEQLMND